MIVAILGTDPDALIAADTAVIAGHAVMLYGPRPRPDRTSPAEYLTSPVPGVNVKGIALARHLVGTVADWRRKVYDRDAESPAVLAERVDGPPLIAWPLKNIYRVLCSTYGNLIVGPVPTPLVPWLAFNKADVVMSSLPAPQLCVADHGFISASSWQSTEFPVGQWWPQLRPPYVIHNGIASPSWHTATSLDDDEMVVEWPDARKPPISNLAKVVRPIRTNCDCAPDVVRLGRLAQWRMTA